MPKVYSYPLTGLKTVQSNLDKALAQIKGATKKGLIEAAFLIEATSKIYVPRDTGNLAGSGRTDWGDGPTGPFAVVHYGGTSETKSYAVHVHERLELRHTPPTQAKYLEQAVKDHFDDILGIVAKHAKV